MFRSVMLLSVIFIITFLSPSKAWATAKQYDKNNEIISLNSNSIWQSTYQSDSSLRIENSNPHKYTWLASILIPGLGQILMGNWEGLNFLIYFSILAAAATLLILSPSLPGIVFLISAMYVVPYIVTILLILLVPAIYIWNLIDAFAMSKNYKDSRSYNLKPEDLALLQEKIESYSQKLLVHNNGSFSLNALTF